MQLDIRQPGSGKTGDAIRWVLQNPSRRILIVFGVHERNRILKLNKELTEAMVKEYQDYLTYQLKYRDKELWLDNADMILTKLFSTHSVTVAGASMTAALQAGEIETSAL